MVTTSFFPQLTYVRGCDTLGGYTVNKNYKIMTRMEIMALEAENDYLRRKIAQAGKVLAEAEEILTKMADKSCTIKDLTTLKNRITDFRTK